MPSIINELLLSIRRENKYKPSTVCMIKIRRGEEWCNMRPLVGSAKRVVRTITRLRRKGREINVKYLVGMGNR